jgi:hypothetical protein
MREGDYSQSAVRFPWTSKYLPQGYDITYNNTQSLSLHQTNIRLAANAYVTFRYDFLLLY